MNNHIKAPPKGVDKVTADQRALMTRALAQRVLMAVLDRGQLLDEAFTRLVEDESLVIEPRDRAFVRLMTTLTLRRLGQVDDVIGRFVNKPLEGSAVRVQHILRLAVAQLLFMETPPHAAVGTAVELVGRERSPALRRLKGMVNAVLRRTAREGADIVAAGDAARLNTPDWLWQSWTNRFGADTARAIAGSILDEPALDLSLRSDADRDMLARQLDAMTSPLGGLRLNARGRIQDLPGFDQGLWWVQDVAASLPAKILNPAPGDCVIDLCAAPGGKTAQLADMGARVTAVDASATRMKRVTENLERLRLGADLVVADAGDYRPDTPVDGVLLDAPCTATGTLRRHPDGKWVKKAGDVAAMAAIQARLLDNAIEMLRPGGTLVYCVCSLEATEGPDQIDRLLASGAPVRRAAVSPGEVGGLEPIILPTGDIQTLPHLGPEMAGGMDGFFISRLIRV